MVTAKFRVTRVTPQGCTQEEIDSGEKKPWAYEVEMTPDYAGGRNKQWADATPQGVIRLLITNLAAVKALPLGSHQGVTFQTEEAE
jgi:hypothetical protein